MIEPEYKIDSYDVVQANGRLSNRITPWNHQLIIWIPYYEPGALPF